MKVINTKSIITGIRSKKDGSLGLTLETPELTSEEKVEFMKLQGVNLNTLFEPTDYDTQETVKVDADLQGKSLSQRQRDSLWVLLKKKLGRKPNEDEWTDAYTKFMENNIDKIKEKIEELGD